MRIRFQKRNGEIWEKKIRQVIPTPINHETVQESRRPFFTPTSHLKNNKKNKNKSKNENKSKNKNNKKIKIVKISMRKHQYKRY